MKRAFLWLVLVGSVVVVLGVLFQAFSIAAYIRSGEEDWLDAHGGMSLIVHLGQLAVVIGALGAFWGRWTAVGAAVGFLVLSIAQLFALGDTEEEGSWANGFHGMLALVVLLAAVAYWQRAKRELGVSWPSGAGGGA
ncbi:MAG TPA: hypothetical protein VNJ53_06580 [Gaiellaceae bacterium]|nr:hypothetical protein [Gaiellaceae bacterium]